ncbi:hypothetical protein Barb7_00359 [Bacteroidales bacterium Barb7]|nr:hypothetical protein Barb7_00359 [Bacteroidales bacterium Barb7]
MEKIIIVVGASSDSFGAYGENIDCMFGCGDTPEEAIENAKEGLRMAINSWTEEQIPDILKGEYEFDYKYDTQSILKHYLGIFTDPALKRITGINPKQLHHYASGLKKPREMQRKKIETALNRLGGQLASMKLV